LIDIRVLSFFYEAGLNWIVGVSDWAIGGEKERKRAEEKRIAG
jgi:hypothetical protein